VCRSPWLIAAYHGLHRLCVPRHPPHAFARLTTKIRKSLCPSRARAIYVITSETARAACRHAIQTLARIPHPPAPLPFLVLIRIPRSLLPTVVKQRSNRRPTTDDPRSHNMQNGRLPRTFRARQASAHPTLTRRSGKEVIQPQVPLRLPCYDFAPVTTLAFGGLAPCGFRHRLRALIASMA
jgi:hypothetical protein